jgi:hypothetical protein
LTITKAGFFDKDAEITIHFMYLQLLMNLIAEIVESYWLALIFQTSHVVSEVRGADDLFIATSMNTMISCTLLFYTFRWNGQNRIKTMLCIWTGKPGTIMVFLCIIID